MARYSSLVLAGLAAMLVGGSGRAAEDWKPPTVATSLEAFELEYPKTTTTAAALELEGLAARLGIDAAPEGPDHEHPGAEAAGRFKATRSAISDYVTRELELPSDTVGPPGDAAARFLEENQAVISSTVGVAVGTREIGWEIDVRLGPKAPRPNLLGLADLQRVLTAQALAEVRRGDATGALETAEAIWRISEALASRPDVLSQLLVIPQARFAVGVLRKVRAPAYGWESRLRDGPFFKSFLAAFQNDSWPFAEDPSHAETVKALTRTNRQFVDGLGERNPCAWTPEDLQRSWEVAASEAPAVAELVANMLMRSYRLLLESELTALVLEARAERAASRDDEWPARLSDLESHVCPGRFYTYARIAGAVTLAFEGKALGGDARGFTLPTTFRGAPPPTRTPTPTASPSAATPTPTASTAS